MGILLYSGCVEDPTVAPTKTPFTVAKFGNFTNNVGNIRILIDPVFNKSIPPKLTVTPEAYVQDSVTVVSWRKEITNLAHGSYSDYFDFVSGDRYLLVYNLDSNKVLLYKSQSFISYEQSTLLITGFYSSSSSLNTVAVSSSKEGTTYIGGILPSDSLKITFYNLISASPSSAEKKLKIILKYSSSSDSMVVKDSTFSGLAFSKSVGRIFGQKDYRIVVLNDTGTTSIDTLAVFPDPSYSDVEGFPIAGYKYLSNKYEYVYYITDNAANKVTVAELKRLPISVRPK